MRTCDTCEMAKPDDQFRLFGRDRKKTCMSCEGSPGEPATETPPEPAEAQGLHLEVSRGFGFRASAENGELVIEQDADDGTASIVLSKTEMKVLAAQFAEWAEGGA